jgi:hypothetical protein
VAVAKPDVPAPVISAAPPALTSSTSASFTFTDAQSGVGFQCALDGAAYAACTSPKAYTVAAGAHTFSVRAVSGAQVSASTTASWTVDTTPPPAPAITARPADQTDASTATFAFTDAEAGVSFQCRLDGAAAAACSSPASFSGLLPGQHTFSISARDGAGNVSAVASTAWTVLPPAPVIASAPPSSTNLTSASFAFGQPLSSPPMTGVTYQCALDGAAFTACASPKAYAGPLSEAQHVFQVRSQANGQQSATTTYRWTVDTTPPPAPTWTATPPALANRTTATFAWTDAEAGTASLCRIDSGAFAACSSPRSFGSLAEGQHTVWVEAVDAAGNVSAPVSYRWTVDSVAPPAPVLTQHPSDPSPGATSTFAWTDQEAGVSYECSVENGAWRACTSPFTTVVSASSNQQHQFGVRAVDAAINASDGTVFAWKVRESAPVDFRLGGSVAGLSPGVWKSIPVTVANPNSAAIYVTAVSVSVAPDSVPAGCATASNIEIQQASGLAADPVMVPAGGSATLPEDRRPRIRLRDLPTNQDVCKGKVFSVTFTGAANN